MNGSKWKQKIGGSKTNGLAIRWEIRPETTPREVVEHMVDKGIEGEIDCAQLERKGRSKAFNVGLDLEKLQKIEDP